MSSCVLGELGEFLGSNTVAKINKALVNKMRGKLV